MTDMTVDDAVKTLRTLEAEAAEGWPYGYDGPAVRSRALEAVAVLAEVVEAAQDPRARAGEFLERIRRRAPYTATVQPKKRVVA